MEHTKGPWVIDRNVSEQGAMIASKTTGQYLATVHTLGIKGAKANANLIVTAPELLADLKRACKYIKKVSDLTLHKERDCADYTLLDELEQTIAKAEIN